MKRKYSIKTKEKTIEREYICIPIRYIIAAIITISEVLATIALLSVLIAPQSAVSYWLDLIGSMIVAVYLMWCGIQTIIEELKKEI